MNDTPSPMVGTHRPSSVDYDTLLQHIAEQVEDGLGVVDSHFSTLVANAQFCRLWQAAGGQSPTIGSPLVPSQPEAAEDTVWLQRLASAFSGKQVTFEQRIGSDQSGTIIAWRLTPFYGNDAAIEGVLLRARQSLQPVDRPASAQQSQVEERYRKLVENAGEAILVAQDGMLRFFNRRTTALTGYSAEDLAVLPFVQLIHPDDRAMVLDRYTRRLRGEMAPDGYSFRYVTKSGAVRWVQISAVPFEWEGRPASLNYLSDITEQIQAQHALIREKQLADALLAALPGTFFVATPDAKYVRIRERSEVDQLFTEIEENPELLKYVVPADRPLVHQTIERAMADGKAVIELRTEDPTGESRAYLVQCVRFIYDDIPYVVGSAIDITQRHRAEARLRDSEGRLRLIFEDSGVGMAIADLQGRILEANRALCEMLGYPAEELIDQSFRLITHPADLAEETELFQLLLSGAVPSVTIEKRYLAKDGTVVWGLLTSSILRSDATGSLIVAQVQNTSALKRAEAERNYQARLVTDVSDAIISTDLDFRIQSWNHAAEVIYGWNEQAALGCEMGDLVPTTYVSVSRTEAQTVLQQTGQWNGEVVQQRRDGTSVQILSSVSFMRDDLGHPIGVVAINKDISEFVQAEENQRQLYEQIRREAETKSELLNEVNHRVKNNLLAIQGMLLAELRFTPEKGRVFVEEAIGNLARRIEGILEAHKLLSETQWAPLSISDLVRQTITASLHSSPLWQKVQVTVAPSPVEVSPRQAGNLALVINELVTNTCKYALDGPTPTQIKVDVAVDAEVIQITYRDNGPGFPDDVLTGDRVGVGLYLLERIVTKTLRGRLSLHNDDGAVTFVSIREEEKGQT